MAGLLYAWLSDDGLQLVAQLDVSGGPFVVGMDGTGMAKGVPERAGLQRIERLDYCAPGDHEWHELARIDKPIEP